MALYLGNSEKLSIVLNGVTYKLNLVTKAAIDSATMLLTSDSYILKTADGFYLVPKTEIKN